jgi:peptidoglycan hydrolase CwlO-like protein
MKKPRLILIRLIGLIGLIGLISSCTPITVSEDQTRQILAADEDFKKVLEMKASLDAQLADLRSQFLSERNIYESKVASLRQEFEAKRTQFYSQTEQIKQQLNPQREKIRSQIAILEEELRNSLKGLRAVKGMLKQAKDIIEGKISQDFSPPDKQVWQKRFDSLTEEAAKASQEIAVIKEKLYILKLKLRSLIQ